LNCTAPALACPPTPAMIKAASNGNKAAGESGDLLWAAFRPRARTLLRIRTGARTTTVPRHWAVMGKSPCLKGLGLGAWTRSARTSAAGQPGRPIAGERIGSPIEFPGSAARPSPGRQVTELGGEPAHGTRVRLERGTLPGHLLQILA